MTQGYTDRGPFNPSNTHCRASLGSGLSLWVNGDSIWRSRHTVCYRTLAALIAVSMWLFEVRSVLCSPGVGGHQSVAGPISREGERNAHMR